MANERVSVVIPAYRCADVIGRAIESLLNQTHKPAEIIVVDDGSPDDIAAAVAKYGEEVRLIRKANGGAASARNAGLDAATGDFIAFLDADDEWDPHKLEKQLAIFRAHPEVGLVSSRYHVVSPEESRFLCPLDGEGTWDTVLTLRGAEAFTFATLVWTGVVIFRRSVLENARFDGAFMVAEDRDLWVRLVTRTAVYLLSDVTATYYEYANSLSHSNVDRDCNDMLKLIRKHNHLLGTSGVRSWEVQVYRRWAAEYLSKGAGARAMAPAIQRLLYQPLSPEGWWVLAKSSYLALGGWRDTSEPQSLAG